MRNFRLNCGIKKLFLGMQAMTANKKKLMCHMASRETEKQKREENCVKSMGSVLWHQNLDVHTRLYILPIAPYRKILLQSNISRIKGRKKIQEW